MAGIGFSLRRLTRQDNLSGIFQAYGHAVFSSTGPWLATVLSLGSISLFGAQMTDAATLQSFRLIVIYNFALSLIAAGPVMMVTTRQIADLVFAKRVDECASLFFGAVLLLTFINLPIMLGLYVFYAEFDPITTAMACINFFLVSGVWLASVFLSTLKAYSRVTLAFFVGLVLGATGALLAVSDFGTAGLLAGFSFGITVTLFVLIGELYAEYPVGRGSYLLIFTAFKNHWILGLNGFVYNIALWMDKFIMWFFAPESEMHSSGLISYPDYDSAMFIAYLTVVPGMSLFLVIVETGFFERYHRYYQDMLNHGTLATIQRNQQSLISTLNAGMRNMIVLQGSLTVLFVFGAVKMFELVQTDLTQLFMFRFGVIGSFFQCMLMFSTVMLSYFDLQRITLTLMSILTILSTVLTIVSINVGYAYYGLGYMAATGITFLISYVILALFMQKLPFNAFIKYNKAITG